MHEQPKTAANICYDVKLGVTADSQMAKIPLLLGAAVPKTNVSNQEAPNFSFNCKKKKKKIKCKNLRITIGTCSIFPESRYCLQPRDHPFMLQFKE